MNALDPQAFNEGLKMSEDLAGNIGQYGKALASCLDVVMKLKTLFGQKKTDREQSEATVEQSATPTMTNGEDGHPATETSDAQPDADGLESRLSDCEDAIYAIADVLEQITTTLNITTDTTGQITKTISQQTQISAQGIKQVTEVSGILTAQEERIRKLESRTKTM